MKWISYKIKQKVTKYITYIKIFNTKDSQGGREEAQGCIDKMTRGCPRFFSIHRGGLREATLFEFLAERILSHKPGDKVLAWSLLAYATCQRAKNMEK